MPRSRPLRALFVEDDPDDVELLVLRLERDGFEVDARRVDTSVALAEALAGPDWDVVFADYNVPGMAPLEAVRLVRAAAPDMPCIVVSGEVGEEVAVATMKAGAQDFVAKERLSRLAPAVEREVGEARRRKAQRASLRESELRFRSVVDSLGEGLLITDLEDVVVHANPRIEELTGYAPEELLGQPAYRFLLDAGDAPEMLERAGRRRQGSVETYEVPLRHKDGRERWVQVHAAPLRNHAGEVVGTIGAMTDITERRRIQERLRLLERAVEDATDAIVITDAEPGPGGWSTIELVNPAFTDMTGYGAEEAIGRYADLLAGAASDPDALEALKQALRSQTAVGVELVIYRKDGSNLWADVSAAPVLDHHGRVGHWVAVLHDITERREAMERIRQLNVELLQTADAYRDLASFGSRIERLHEVDVLVREGLENLVRHLGLDVGGYFTLEDDAYRREEAWGAWPPELERAFSVPVPAGSGAFSRAAESGGPVLTEDYASWEHAQDPFRALGLRTVLALPVRRGDRTLGVISLASLHRAVALSPDDVVVATSFVRRLENALERADYIEDLTATREATFRALGVALEYRDYETKGHTDRVVALARRFGRELAFDGPTLQALEWGAYLHDLGKIAISDAILLKPGRLDAAEYEAVKRHTVYGFEMTAAIPFLPDDTRAVVRWHHERWDGAGYPDGLAGEAIPRVARMFALVDVYDALTSERPYKRAWSAEEARAEIAAQAGSQFDPELTEVFLRIVA